MKTIIIAFKTPLVRSHIKDTHQIILTGAAPPSIIRRSIQGNARCFYKARERIHCNSPVSEVSCSSLDSSWPYPLKTPWFPISLFQGVEPLPLSCIWHLSWLFLVPLKLHPDLHPLCVSYCSWTASTTLLSHDLDWLCDGLPLQIATAIGSIYLVWVGSFSHELLVTHFFSS